MGVLIVRHYDHLGGNVYTEMERTTTGRLPSK
jgi:UDP-galactopyranose mutase